MFLRSLRSFSCVSWRYLPSTDISCRPHFRCFFPSFLCCYLFSKCNIHFFILDFSDPTSLLFSVFLSLCSTFPIFYFLPFSSLCLSLHFLYFLFLSFLSAFCFLAAFYLSSLPLTFFVYHLIFLSAFISFFVFYFPSLLFSTFILCLSSVLSILLLTLLFILLYICVCVFCYCCYHYYFYYHFYPPVFFFCFFCLFFNLGLFLEL